MPENSENLVRRDAEDPRLLQSQQQLLVIITELTAAMNDAGDSIEALEILMDGKRSPTHSIEQLQKRLSDSKERLGRAKKEYQKFESQLKSIISQGSLETKE